MSQQDMDLLLWLHAEAVWLARYEDEDDGEVRTLPELIALLRTRHELARLLYIEAEKDHKQAEASRRDWAAEAMRLQHVVDQMIAGAHNTGRTFGSARAVHPEQAAAPGPHHPAGSPEGDFQPSPQTGQQHPESTSRAVHPEADR